MATRDVQFIIRARDEASRAFDGITNALGELSRANGATGATSNVLSTDLGRLVQALGSVDQVARLVNGASARAGTSFEEQRSKVNALEGDLANLKAQSLAAANALSSVKAAGAATGNNEAEASKVKGIEAAQKQLNTQIDATSRKLTVARTDLNALGLEYQRAASLANAFDAAQPGIKSGQESAAATKALQDQTAWAGQLRAQMNPLAGIQEHYRTEIEKANGALKANVITEQEHLAIVKMLNSEQKKSLATAGVGPDGRPSLLGLKPWQATNLMYQVNDVVSGFAMGQKPSQIIAQQLGQIVQLFPRLGSGIMAAFGNPYLLGAAAIFTTIAFATKQAADQAERLRTIAGILRANADGAQYNAAALNDNVKALERYHLGADEALTITRTFIKDGLDPAYFERFGMAAKDMSRILGVDVKDAAQQVADAFVGGYDSVAKLDDATNFLTASEREHIRAMFDSGHAADARAEAFDKFQKAQHDAAEQMRGPWTQAIEHLDTAWHRFTATLADSSWANFLRAHLEALASTLDLVAGAFDHANTNASVTVDLPAATKATAEQEARARAAGNDPRAGGNKDDKAVADARTEIGLQRELQNATGDTARVRVLGEQAYRSEIEKTGNKAVAELKRQAAQEAEITRIQMERRKSLVSSSEQFLGKRESNREDVAVLEGLFNQYGIKTPQGGTVDPAKLAWCAAFVNAMLASKGLPTTGSLAASSFSSYGKGVKVEEAQSGDIVVFDHHVGFFAGFGPNGTVRIIGGNQGKPGQGAVSTSNFKRSGILSVRRPGDIAEGYEGQDSEAQYAMQIAAAQDSFNKKIEVEAAQRALVIKYMRDQLSLSVDALYASQKQEEIEKAILTAKQEALDKHIVFSPDQEKALRQEIGDQYDAEHAMQLVNDRIKEQTDLRAALMQGIAEASQRGDDATVSRLTEQLNALTPALEDAIKKAEDFWQTLPDSPAKTAALEGFRELRDEVNSTAAALGKLKLEAASTKIEGATSLQSGLTSQIDQSQLLGDKQGARDAQSQLQQVNDQLIQLRQNAIDAAMAMLQLSDAELASQGFTRDGLRATILGLKAAQQESKILGRQFLMTGRQINESLADQATGAVDNFFQSMKAGQNIISALWQTFIQFAADFLRQIGLMILKQALFNALNRGAPGGGGGAGGFFSTLISGLFHGGGVAGAPSMFRTVSPGAFAGAIRYHTGGLAGLQPDEVPAILRRGEEVLTENDARHRKNAGRDTPGGGPRGIRQILAVGDEEIAKAMAEGAGEDVVLTHIRRNRLTIRQMLSE